MSETVQLALIEKVPSIVIAITTIVTAWLTYRTHRVAKQTEENTNHLKDELVQEVRQASFAAGQKQEKDKDKK